MNTSKTRFLVDHKAGDIDFSVPVSDVWFMICNRFPTRRNSRPALTKFGEIVSAAGVPTVVENQADRRKVVSFLNGIKAQLDKMELFS